MASPPKMRRQLPLRAGLVALASSSTVTDAQLLLTGGVGSRLPMADEAAGRALPQAANLLSHAQSGPTPRRRDTKVPWHSQAQTYDEEDENDELQNQHQAEGENGIHETEMLAEEDAVAEQGKKASESWTSILTRMIKGQRYDYAGAVAGQEPERERFAYEEEQFEREAASANIRGTRYVDPDLLYEDTNAQQERATPRGGTTTPANSYVGAGAIKNATGMVTTAKTRPAAPAPQAKGEVPCGTSSQYFDEEDEELSPEELHPASYQPPLRVTKPDTSAVLALFTQLKRHFRQYVYGLSPEEAELNQGDIMSDKTFQVLTERVQAMTRKRFGLFDAKVVGGGGGESRSGSSGGGSSAEVDGGPQWEVFSLNEYEELQECEEGAEDCCDDSDADCMGMSRGSGPSPRQLARVAAAGRGRSKVLEEKQLREEAEAALNDDPRPRKMGKEAATKARVGNATKRTEEQSLFGGEVLRPSKNGGATAIRFPSSFSSPRGGFEAGEVGVV